MLYRGELLRLNIYYKNTAHADCLFLEDVRIFFQYGVVGACKKYHRSIHAE